MQDDCEFDTDDDDDDDDVVAADEDKLLPICKLVSNEYDKWSM